VGEHKIRGNTVGYRLRAEHRAFVCRLPDSRCQIVCEDTSIAVVAWVTHALVQCSN